MPAIDPIERARGRTSVNRVDIDLYERALEVIDELLIELEQLDKIPVTFDVPEDLRKAWIEREALAETLKFVSESGGPRVRDELTELYKAKLDDAEVYGSEFEDINGPEINKDLVEKAETLLEEERRARLLA